MTIQFDSTEDLIRYTERLINSVAHERYWEKRWMKMFGYANRQNMEKWQGRSDVLISEAQITNMDLQKDIEITIKPTENESGN